MATHSEHARYITKWRIGHTQSLLRRTYPRLRNYQDNAKLVFHSTARYKMEWIYTETKMSGQGSLGNEKESYTLSRKKE